MYIYVYIYTCKYIHITNEYVRNCTLFHQTDHWNYPNFVSQHPPFVSTRATRCSWVSWYSTPHRCTLHTSVHWNLEPRSTKNIATNFTFGGILYHLSNIYIYVLHLSIIICCCWFPGKFSLHQPLTGTMTMNFHHFKLASMVHYADSTCWNSMNNGRFSITTAAGFLSSTVFHYTVWLLGILIIASHNPYSGRLIYI